MKVPVSTFRRLTGKYLEQVRCWRNLPRIRINMLTDREISPCEQKAWYERLKDDASKIYLVFFQDVKPIGMLYFTEINTSSCSWGCYIGEEAVWPGSGLILEVAALEYAFNLLNVDSLNAEVLEFNVSPQKMHKFFGYQIATTMQDAVVRNGDSYTLVKYTYPRNEWLSARDRVLASLPKQIQLAVENIVYS